MTWYILAHMPYFRRPGHILQELVLWYCTSETWTKDMVMSSTYNLPNDSDKRYPGWRIGITHRNRKQLYQYQYYYQFCQNDRVVEKDRSAKHPTHKHTQITEVQLQHHKSKITTTKHTHKICICLRGKNARQNGTQLTPLTVYKIVYGTEFQRNGLFAAKENDMQ